MSKSMIVAVTDFKNAIQLKFVKYGLILAAAFGPVVNILMVVSIMMVVPPDAFNEIMMFLGPYVPALLGIFAIIPTSMISANALVGEREMNTLEPILCTPLTDRELLWGKTMAAALPSLIILVTSTVATTVGIAIVSIVMGYPLLIIPDLAGLFLLSTSAPLIIFAIVAVMIIISGRVTRVYEAYQTTSAIVLVFMIPIFLPLLGMDSGVTDPNLTWIANIVTLLISLVLFVVSWTIALRLFNRDTLVSMV